MPKLIPAPAHTQHKLGRRPGSSQDVAMALAQGGRDRVPYLTAGLNCHEEEVQRASGRALMQCGEPGMLALLRTAAHGSRRARLAAVECLGECRDPRALRPLIEALQNDRTDRMVRRSLRVSLALLLSAFIALLTPRIGNEWSDETAAEIWDSALEPDMELRVSAARALGMLGNVRALVPLLPMAHHKEPKVRQEACLAIARLLPGACEMPPEQVLAAVPNLTPALAELLGEAGESLKRQILALLMRVGDVRALPAVEKVAVDLFRADLAATAQQLCDLLRERARREEARATLLRGAAGSPAVPCMELLHPAFPHSVPDSREELLRAVVAQPEHGPESAPQAEDQRRS